MPLLGETLNKKILNTFFPVVQGSPGAHPGEPFFEFIMVVLSVVSSAYLLCKIERLAVFVC
jgi:hypothetical protein